jgi:hypothetical protein
MMQLVLCAPRKFIDYEGSDSVVFLSQYAHIVQRGKSTIQFHPRPLQ